LLALAIAAATAAAPATAATPPGTPLGHSGRWLTDADGRVVILHGLNMTYKLPPYYPAAVGFDADDAAFLKSEGFNTVRLGIILKALEPAPGVYDGGYLERIRQTARLLGDAGIHVLIDFHQDMYNERFNGEGWPDWAVQDDGLAAEPDVGFPGNYFVMTALWRAYDHFFANDPGPGGIGLVQRYASAWRYVAQAFRSEREILGYDILNEPFPGSVWTTCANPEGCPVFDEGPLSLMTLRVLAAIRSADPTRLVLYEPNVTFNFGADTHHVDTGDANAGFSFHDYCLASLQFLPQLQTTSDACGVEQSIPFDNADKHSTSTGDALLLTEFGATDDPTALERVLDLADQHMVSWQEWTYWGVDPCCARPEEGVIIDPSKPPSADNVKQVKLDALTRSYPRAVAGTPESFGFDRASKQFDLAYSTSRAGGGLLPARAKTEVELPKRQYPCGYRADVSGGKVVSEAGAEVLRIASLDGAARVTVRVTPVACG
jgi:endoglycosylceramidase